VTQSYGKAAGSLSEKAEWVAPDYSENYTVLLEEEDNGKTQHEVQSPSMQSKQAK
jgi:hypothetical protein